MMKISITLALCVISYFEVLAQFNNELIIPDTLSGTQFDLNVQAGTTDFLGTPTATYGYNGNFLGPTLIFNRFDSVNIDVTNQLAEETTVHWHGLEVPARFDGGPHNVIDVNETWDVGFRILDHASTMWYHSHLHFNTQRQVNKGLAGMIIIRDDEESALDLPRTYGVDDIPLILQDKMFNPQGELVDTMHMGNHWLINGTIGPYKDVPAQMVRLRLLCASSHRPFVLGFSDNRDFSIIASDGGLLAAPVDTNRLIMTPGERYEIMVDLSADQGQSLFLRTYASEMPIFYTGGPSIIPDDPAPSTLNGLDSSLVMFNVVAPTPDPVAAVPSTLANITVYDEALSSRERYNTLTALQPPGQPIRWFINGTQYQHNVNNDTIAPNTYEIWTVHNFSAAVHPFHIHGGYFHILDRNGNPPPMHERGRKDVVPVTGDEVIRFIMRFPDYPDPEYAFMYHCHLLAHEDGGMMAQFIIADSSFINSVLVPEETLSKMYPNPATDVITVEFPNDARTLVVSDLEGQIAQRIDLRKQKGFVQLEISELPAGLYNVMIFREEGTELIKLVKP